MDILGPRGTFDVLPEESFRWQRMESMLRQVAELYGYGEVRLPVFEHTELFERGVGDSTDIVQKEMYTFRDRGDRSLTLRPEGTACSARAYLQHRIFNQAQPVKWFYMGPMFRYDRPESGRYRQFHQFGLEAFGSQDPTLDAEVICLMVRMVEALGLSEYELHLNTVGCPRCRPLYRERLKQFLKLKVDSLCYDCRQRANRNPLRVLDCKNQDCQAVISGFPVLSDYLCERCSQHFAVVKDTLEIYAVEYLLDDQLVRGLDYYTNTAFELLLPGIGAQGAVGGGGRYDGLIEELGGPPVAGIGFALGMERLLLALKAQDNKFNNRPKMQVFVAIMDKEFEKEACCLVDLLRREGIRADKDYMGRSLKAQMKYANRLGAGLVAIIGEEEIAQGGYMLRDMERQEQYVVPAGEIVERVKGLIG